MPKQKGKHPERALTSVRIRALCEPGRYADGNGLYIVVDPSGAKRWVLRTTVRGRRSDIGLGGLSLVSLAEAREKALSYRKSARDGRDPAAERRHARAIIPTFADAAEKVHAEHKGSWKNSKHRQQWLNTLEQYAFPTIGDMPVDRIGTPDILRVLSPIWLTKSETARRVRQRIGTVLDWAKASGFRTGDNPVSGVGKGLPKQTDSGDHHTALPYQQVPRFIHQLQASENNELVRLALEFLILTAARTSEVLGAKWEEVKMDGSVWIIPAERMKAHREHRIPLVGRMLVILNRARELGGGSGYIFPGRAGTKPLSNMAFLMLLRRMKVDVTAHGFRSSFRDWAAEKTNFPREVCEMALAHRIDNRVEAAYRRGDLLEKRRELMASWAEFVSTADE